MSLKFCRGVAGHQERAAHDREGAAHEEEKNRVLMAGFDLMIIIIMTNFVC